MFGIKRFSNTYRRLHKYLHNSSWIMGEKVVSLGFAFIATVFVARHLGPEAFGALAYAVSLVALFGAAGHMGLQGLVVREIIKDPEGRAETLGTVITLKLLGMSVGYAALLVYAAVYEGTGSTEFALIAICGAALLFRPFDVIDFWFQAFLQAKYTAIAHVVSQIAATGLKLTLVLVGAGVIYFAAAQLLQAVVAALLLLVFFRVKADLHLLHWRFEWRRARELLSQGWLIYLGSIFAVIYLKVDQVMLRWLADTQEVGQYAVAAQLSQAWYFIPTAIVASFFPKLIELRGRDEGLFKHRMQQLLDALFIIALCVSLVVTLIAPWVITLFFGSDYAASAPILVIHIWTAIFIFMRAAFSRWILIENVLVFSLITQGLGAATNVVLNYFLIPSYGGVGAAYGTLLSFAMASFFALFFYKKTRGVFWQMAWATLSPIRYLTHFFRFR